MTHSNCKPPSRPRPGCALIVGVRTLGPGATLLAPRPGQALDRSAAIGMNGVDQVCAAGRAFLKEPDS